MHVFELLMLICFGVSWPFNVVKSIRTRSAKGKSLVFLVAIWLGYIFGIINKLLYSRDVVMWAYVFNFAMITADLLLYFRNRALDRAREAASPQEK